MEGEGWGEAELLDEGGHDFGVVFCIGLRISRSGIGEELGGMLA